MIPETNERPQTLSEALRMQRGFLNDAVAASTREDPFFPEIARAGRWLVEKAKPNARVFINADYDVDGITIIVPVFCHGCAKA